MWIRSIVVAMALVSGTVLVAACSGGTVDDGDALPACPSGGSDLTYANFGKAFFEGNCTSCHSEGSGVGDAQDLPFESQADIQAQLGDIYNEAGGSNTGMPPNGGPTAAEREQLAEWLSCGAK